MMVAGEKNRWQESSGWTGLSSAATVWRRRRRREQMRIKASSWLKHEIEEALGDASVAGELGDAGVLERSMMAATVLGRERARAELGAIGSFGLFEFGYDGAEEEEVGAEKVEFVRWVILNWAEREEVMAGGQRLWAEAAVQERRKHEAELGSSEITVEVKGEGNCGREVCEVASATVVLGGGRWAEHGCFAGRGGEAEKGTVVEMGGTRKERNATAGSNG
ncbi:hypothetical protein M0R45_034583 [Rubus argutus]|uniref:Uncharacterized protein n=1 Tax=Rubus argutus TaxID=59490 RepID=A0AAW1VUW5_RUBAR